MEYSIIINWCRRFEGNTVNVGKRYTVNDTILFPHLLNDNISVYVTIKINISISNTVNISIKKCIKIAIFLPVDEARLLGKCRDREHCCEHCHQQTEKNYLLFHGISVLRV